MREVVGHRVRLIARIALPAVLACLLAGSPALANPGVFGAAYGTPTVPATIVATATFQVSVSLTNTGDEPWTAGGSHPVHLSYHWYDPAGAPQGWEGAGTFIGSIPVVPLGKMTVNANVVAPATAGQYALRFALVKEGVTWFEPGAPALVTVQPAMLTASYVAQTPPQAAPAGNAIQIAVALTNNGNQTWSVAGSNPVNLTYHWYDATGNTVISWDGLRTALGADVAPTTSKTVTANVLVPKHPGQYHLRFALVKEGVTWFPPSVPLPIFAQAAYVAQVTANAVPPMIAGGTYTVVANLKNTGAAAWNFAGANPIAVSYHWHDASGNTVVWDGLRTPLAADIAPGATATANVKVATPQMGGTYTLTVDLVRDGIGWLGGTGGSQPLRVPLTVDTARFAASYGIPQQLDTFWAEQKTLSVQITNTGGKTWSAAGANPVHLGYHIIGANSGTTYVWDGARGTLPTDVKPGTQTTVPMHVQLPANTGDYILAWDLVQEGVAWFSQVNVPMKNEPFTVVSGVVFYGSGFGHGVGMSQYGANGLAYGVTGRPYTGEQIVAQYFPGTTLQFGDAARPYNRVLLSQPSSQSRYRCGTNRYFDGYFGDVISNGGFHVLDESKANAEIGRATPGAKWQFVASNGVVEAWSSNTATPTLVGTFTSVAVVPLDPGNPLRFVQKDQLDGRPGFYRGNLRFTNLGNTLRAINAVSYDDYVRGVISFEMPNTWAAEALKAQAYAARSYAYASYRGVARDYDVSDDQADQCYAGVTAEGPRTDLAVAMTAGKIVTWNNAPVKTYFASSSGGYTKDFGCWGTRVVRSASGTWICTPDASQPFLAAVPDPADRLVSAPANPRASWSVTFNSSQIANAVICAGGPNIGVLQGVDVTNRFPVDVGHAVSIRFYGTAANADVRAESIQSCLGLRSTMLKLAPF